MTIPEAAITLNSLMTKVERFEKWTAYPADAEAMRVLLSVYERARQKVAADPTRTKGERA